MSYDYRLPDGRVIRVPAGTPMSVAEQWARRDFPELYAPKEVEAPKAGRGNMLGDVAGSVISGVGGLASLPGQIATVVGGARPDNVVTQFGEGIQEFGRSLQSDKLKEQQLKLQLAQQEAEKQGFSAEVAAALKQYASNPYLTLNALIEQLPQLVVSLGAGKAAQLGTKALMPSVTEKGLQTAAVAGASGAGAAMQGGDIGAETYERVYNAAIRLGLPEETAKARALEEARKAALKAGALSAATMAVLPGAEKALLGAQPARGMLRGAARTGAGEGVQEAIEEGGGAYFAGQGEKSVDPSVDPLRGAGFRAGQGAILGAGLGVGAGGFQGAAVQREERQKELLATQQAENESRRAAAEQRRAEEERKKSPEYLLERQKEFDAKRAEMQQIQARIKEIGKVDKFSVEAAEKAELEKRRQELGKEMQPLAQELNQRKKEIERIKEEARVAGMDPYEFFMERNYPGSTQSTEQAELGPDEYAANVRPMQKPTASYAEQRMAAVSQMGMPTINDAVQALMQDRAQAEEFLKSGEAVPGFDAEDSEAVRGFLNLQLKEYKEEESKRGARKAKDAAEEADFMRALREAEELQATLATRPSVPSGPRAEVAAPTEAGTEPTEEEVASRKEIEDATQDYRNALAEYLFYKRFYPDTPKPELLKAVNQKKRALDSLVKPVEEEKTGGIAKIVDFLAPNDEALKKLTPDARTEAIKELTKEEARLQEQVRQYDDTVRSGVAEDVQLDKNGRVTEAGRKIALAESMREDAAAKLKQVTEALQRAYAVQAQLAPQRDFSGIEALIDKALERPSGVSSTPPDELERRVENLAEIRRDLLEKYTGLVSGATFDTKLRIGQPVPDRERQIQQAKAELITAAIEEIKAQRELAELPPLTIPDRALAAQISRALDKRFVEASPKKREDRVTAKQSPSGKRQAIVDRISEITITLNRADPESGDLELTQEEKVKYRAERDALRRRLEKLSLREDPYFRRDQEFFSVIDRQLNSVRARLRELTGIDAERNERRAIGAMSAYAGRNPEKAGEIQRLVGALISLNKRRASGFGGQEYARNLQDIVDRYTVFSGQSAAQLRKKGIDTGKGQPRRIPGAEGFQLGQRQIPAKEEPTGNLERPYRMRAMRPGEGEFKATQDEQKLVRAMRERDIADIDEAVTSGRLKEDGAAKADEALQKLIDQVDAPATQEEVERATKLFVTPQEGQMDLFGEGAVRSAQEARQAQAQQEDWAGRYKSAVGRALAGMRGKSPLKDAVDRLAAKFGKGTADVDAGSAYAKAKASLDEARAIAKAIDRQLKEAEAETSAATRFVLRMQSERGELAAREMSRSIAAIKKRLEEARRADEAKVAAPVIDARLKEATAILNEIRDLQGMLTRLSPDYNPLVGQGRVTETQQKAAKEAQEIYRNLAALEDRLEGLNASVKNAKKELKDKNKAAEALYDESGKPLWPADVQARKEAAARAEGRLVSAEKAKKELTPVVKRELRNLPGFTQRMDELAKDIAKVIEDANKFQAQLAERNAPIQQKIKALEDRLSELRADIAKDGIGASADVTRLNKQGKPVQQVVAALYQLKQAEKALEGKQKELDAQLETVSRMGAAEGNKEAYDKLIKLQVETEPLAREVDAALDRVSKAVSAAEGAAPKIRQRAIAEESSATERRERSKNRYEEQQRRIELVYGVPETKSGESAVRKTSFEEEYEKRKAVQETPRKQRKESDEFDYEPQGFAPAKRVPKEQPRTPYGRSYYENVEGIGAEAREARATARAERAAARKQPDIVEANEKEMRIAVPEEASSAVRFKLAGWLRAKGFNDQADAVEDGAAEVMLRNWLVRKGSVKSVEAATERVASAEQPVLIVQRKQMSEAESLQAAIKAARAQFNAAVAQGQKETQIRPQRNAGKPTFNTGVAEADKRKPGRKFTPTQRELEADTDISGFGEQDLLFSPEMAEGAPPKAASGAAIIRRDLEGSGVRSLDRENPLYAKKLSEAAQMTAAKVRNPFKKALLLTLADVLKNVDGRVITGWGTTQIKQPDGSYRTFNTPSHYSPNAHYVFLNVGTGEIDPDVILHELVHAATALGLRANPEFKARVQALLDKAKAFYESPQGQAYAKNNEKLVKTTREGVKTIYGLKNVDEFLAEAMSNSAFQAFLKQIPTENKKSNLWTRFVEAVAKLLNATKPAELGLLADVLAITEEAMHLTSALGGKTDAKDVGEGVLYAPTVEHADKSVGDAADVIIGRNRNKLADIRAEANGLHFRVRFVDRNAALKKAVEQGDPAMAMQVTYDLMNYDQRNHFVQQAIMEGAPTREWWSNEKGRDIYKTEVKGGPSLRRVSELLGKIEGYGNPQAVSDAFTLLALAKRAQTRGWDRVFGDKPGSTPEVLAENQKRQQARERADALAKELDKGDSPFKEAYEEYQAFNKGMLQFAQQAGVISKDEFRRLASEQNYTPLFRADKNGNLLMEIDQGRDITVGSLKDEPHLIKMLGGDGQVMDFFTASVRSASIIVDASLHNIASREAVFALRALGAARPAGKTEKSENIIEFRGDGEKDSQRFVIDTDAVGVPTDLVVKGFAGVPASLPGIVRLAGVPATLLRRAVTRNPLYMIRQLVRDPMSAWLATGAKFNPITDTLREVNKALKGTADKTLDRRGITGGVIFSDDPADMERIRDSAMKADSKGIGYIMAKLDEMAIAADAATRRNVYNGAIKEGASEIQATIAAYEAMPFSKRGTSPSVRYLNHMVPFLSAAIQGWDVLYRSAIKGDMPLQDRVDVRQKLLQRGMLIAGMTMLYAMAVADDEEYKNANTSERMNNWFVRLPGTEQTLKVPIPFEFGVIFKMIPEALVRSAAEDKELSKELRNVGGAVWGMVPNVMVPQAVLPMVEAMLNKSFFTDSPIEGRALQNLDIGMRADSKTTELSKLLGFDVEIFGTQLGISPKMLEYVMSQYTAGLYPAFAAMIDTVLPAPTAAKPDRTLAELPLFRSALVQEDAGGNVNRLYDEIEKFMRYSNTFKRLQETDPTKAAEYLAENQENIAKGAVAGKAKAAIDKFSNLQRKIEQDLQMDSAQKKAALDNIKRLKNQLAEQYGAAL